MTLGLIKFFNNDTYRQDFIDGMLYCNSAEYYRTHTSPGVADPYESCIYSFTDGIGYRTSPKVEFSLKKNFKKSLCIDSFNKLMLKRKGDADSWMHCWFELRSPKNIAELEEQKDNIDRLKKDFGKYLVFIPTENISSFVKRIQEDAPLEYSCGRVNYSANRFDWFSYCKSYDYSYQQEVRFCFGENLERSVEEKKIKYIKGFKDLFIYSMWLRVKQDGHIVVETFL